MADLTGGLTGAASGAATGAGLGSIIPGPGTAIGAAAGGVIGGISGLFGGDGGGGGGGQQRQQRGDRLRSLFEDRVERLRQTSPTETASFQAGTGALQDIMGEQQRRDASAAAARGLSGSQFELAQQAQRTQTLGRQTRRLVGESERRLASDRQSALRGLLSASGFQADVEARRQRREARKTSRLADLAGTALQAGATIFASRGGGGSSS